VAWRTTSLLLCGLYARLGHNQAIGQFLAGNKLGIDGLMPAYIALAFPPLLTALISVAVLAAGMSTLDGILVALSAILANDVYLTLVKDREAHLRRAFRLSQGSLLLGGVATFFLALDQRRRKELTIALFAQDGIYGLFAATCLPVLFGLFPGWRPSRAGVLLSSLAALAVHFGIRRAKLTFLTAADWTNPGLTVTYALAAALLVIAIDWAVGRAAAAKQP
jgi:sodium/pantothenate symporter